MTDAPERIMHFAKALRSVGHIIPMGDTEYLRADIAAAATERAVWAALEMAAQLIYADNYDDPESAGDDIRAIAADPAAMAKIIEGAQDGSLPLG